MADMTVVTMAARTAALMAYLWDTMMVTMMVVSTADTSAAL